MLLVISSNVAFNFTRSFNCVQVMNIPLGNVCCSKFYVVVLEAWHRHSEEVRNKSVVSSESLKTIAAVSPFCSSNENCMKCCVLLVYNQLYK